MSQYLGNCLTGLAYGSGTPDLPRGTQQPAEPRHTRSAVYTGVIDRTTDDGWKVALFGPPVEKPKAPKKKRNNTRTVSTAKTPRRQPFECAGCGRMTRPCRATREEFPGTVTYGGHLACYHCVREHGRPRKQRLSFPRPCDGCGRPLRSSQTRSEDAPGSMSHRSDGLCWSCWDRKHGK
jgi:hypothetical protein